MRLSGAGAGNRQSFCHPQAGGISEAIYDGQSEIEGVTCLKVSDFAEAKAVLEAGAIPMMMDETCEILKEVRPWALVDAILAKRT